MYSQFFQSVTANIQSCI